MPITSDTIYCAYCSMARLRDESIEGLNGVYYCEDCHQGLFNFCYECGKLVYKGDLKNYDGNSYCSTCISKFETCCDACGKKVETPVTNYFGTYCETCEKELFGTCIQCNNTYEINRLYIDAEGDLICADCENDLYSWPLGNFAPRISTYVELDSERAFGIEIETSKCGGFSSLHNNTFWGCTNDYSITGKEFISPPLYGDQGLQTIRHFCEMAITKNWETDSHCGLHLHIGVGDLGADQLKSIAYAYNITYKLWRLLVPNSRASNTMCGPPQYPVSEITNINTKDIEDWEYFVAERDRFEFINWRAYMVHGTVELRILNGTLDAELICNWTKTHIKFLNYVSKKSIDELELFLSGDVYYQFSALTEIIGSELATYYVGVSTTHGSSVRPNEFCWAPF